MSKDALHHAAKRTGGGAKRSKWRRIVSLLSCLVVFCTTYALILPALTIEAGQELVCTIAEASHVHTADCYRQREILPEDAPPAPAQSPTVDAPAEDTAGSPADDAAAPMDDAAQPTDDAAASTDDAAKPADDRAAQADAPAEPAETPAAEPAEDPAKPAAGVTTMRRRGADYTVTVAFGPEAGLPADVELSVRELAAGTREYQTYYRATQALLADNQELLACRFFDVSFQAAGREIEPEAPVDVRIDYETPLTEQEGAECTAVHFAESGVELLDAERKSSAGGDVVTFTQDSFSVVGTAITTLNLDDGSYLFYKDGYALGVSGGRLLPVEVKVDENGYVYVPQYVGNSIDDITWTYRNGKLQNKATGYYLSLSDSGAGISAAGTAISARIINNAVRFSTEVRGYYGSVNYYLGVNDNTGRYTAGSLFADGDYFTAAKIATVSDNPEQPYALEVRDDVRGSGTLVPDWTDGAPEGALSYRWYRSADGGQTWTPVTRRRVTGSSYNVAEDGSWLNVALDGGADLDYMVELVSADGVQVSGAVSHIFHVPYYDSLQNGDFENPKISTDVSDAEHYQPFLPNGTAGMVWKTTAADGEIEFISVASSAFQEMSSKWHNCPAAASGKQFVELNANMPGALYQDVLTTPNTTMYWKLSHRGRGTSDGSGYNPDSEDTMYVVIMSTELAEKYNVTTQDAVRDVIGNPAKYPGASVKKITSDCEAWRVNSGSYTVPEDQYLTRYFFVAGDTAFDKYNQGSNIRQTVGNHLDNVYFSTELPPPDAGEANLKVYKTVSGLGEEDARAVFEKLTFTVSTGQTLRYENLESLTDNGDGTYTGVYPLRIELGSRTSISCRVAEDTGTAEAPDAARYTRRTTAGTAPNGQTERADVTQTVREASTAEYYFTNLYRESAAEFALLKIDEANNGLSGAQFLLERWDGAAWEALDTLTTDRNGLASRADMPRDTLLRLTEVQAPAGYRPLSEPVYLKIQRVREGSSYADRLLPCDAEGNAAEWPQDVSLSEANSVRLKVVNHAGMVLPETGGPGRVAFYLAGAILMGMAIFCGWYGNRKRKDSRYC